MSAFILPAYHISVLGAFAVSRRPAILYHNGQTIDLHHAREVACDLWKQNVRSVNARYTTKEQPRFTFDSRALLLGGVSMVQIIKAAQRYQYQSCETDDWEDCYAHGLYLHIVAEAIPRLAGYEAAEWVLDPPRRAG